MGREGYRKGKDKEVRQLFGLEEREPVKEEVAVKARVEFWKREKAERHGLGASFPKDLGTHSRAAYAVARDVIDESVVKAKLFPGVDMIKYINAGGNPIDENKYNTTMDAKARELLGFPPEESKKE